MSNEEGEFKSTKQVLELIGLAQDEIDSYFHLTGRGPVMIGEIALIADVPEERAAVIAKNLLTKGLVREIPGKTPFYVALPPYTALLNQIEQFKKVVEHIQQSTPKELEIKFKRIEEQSAKLGKLNDYRKYIQIMKANLPAQIKAQFSRVEGELESVKKFQEIRSFILNLREIVPEEIIKEFEVVETRLEKIKSEISIAFEKQFRIGALKNMAEKIVSRIISEQFVDLTDYFKEKFVRAVNNTLDKLTDQLATISEAAGEMSTDLGATLSEIETGLKDTLEDLDGRISTVYEDVESGIEELKEMFQKEIYATLEEDIMKNILQQLELSKATMTEFWERSKKASMLTFKDVWFVRSIEGMRAQINESISRVKMRVHVVTPRLDDLDLVALSKLKKHTNVRISTNFDWNNPKDLEMLAEISQYRNFDIRHYPRENLWSINRDHEEVVVSVISRSDLGDVEIAGMGSILSEHVKLFAAVLEDVWIQSKKISGLESLIESVKPAQKPQKTYEFQRPKVIPKEIEIFNPDAPIETEPQFNSPLVPKRNAVDPIRQKPKIAAQPMQKEIIQPALKVDTGDNSSKSLGERFDLLVSNLDSKAGTDIGDDLEQLRNDIVEERGYSSVLNQISIGIAGLKLIPRIMSSLEAQDFLKKLNFWRKKLNL